jgi:hypothetical protein
MKFTQFLINKLQTYSLPATLTLVFLGTLLSACGGNPSGTATPTATLKPVEATAPPAPSTPLPTASPIPLPPLGLLIAPEGSSELVVPTIAEMLQSLSMDTGLVWEVRNGLSSGEIPAGVQMVVALYPTTNLNELVAAEPDIPFLAIGIPGLTPAPNLSQIEGDGFRPDQAAFLAGYLAAIITEDWRVGVLNLSGSGSGLAARRGFLNGARYFCGLCRPVFPPFENYPLFVDIPPGAGQSDWQSAADLLLAKGVETIYLAPGLELEGLQEYLADNGVLIIGSTSRSAAPAVSWVASVRVAPEVALFEIWPVFSEGETNVKIPLPLVVTDVNETYLSPGRLQLVEAMVPELLEGIVDSGVDPTTGEPR